MNDTLGDDPGQNDISQQDLISDDVANAITSALNGDEMDGSSTPPTTVKPSRPSPPPPNTDEPYKYTKHPASQIEPPSHEEPAQNLPAPAPEPNPQPSQPASDKPEITDRGSGNVSELYDIKQEALKQLSPLVEHLEQSAEERFDTLIMMLRASDDPALIRPAYEAAQAIEDDKSRAQALLDVVNEVNYLTRPDTEQ
ncbi:MAG TPA: hypothetical protein VF996_03380 [Candidatus Saccharimonadales bacterium]|jgi:hypothetical protein